MAQIYAGTAYNQMIAFDSTVNKKKKMVYGPLTKNIVHSIAYNKADENIFYATSSNINMAFHDGSSNQLIKIRGPESIIKIQFDDESASLRYGLSNGAVKGISSKIEKFSNDYTDMVFFKGENAHKFSGSCSNQNKQKYLFYGKGVLPYICNLAMGIVQWRGKNVKHDQLDLQVPINDIDGAFGLEDKFISILNAQNKLRIYDVRGTKRRPVNDLILRTTAKARLTKMKVSQCKNYYFIGNDIGEIFQCDSRKNYEPIGKFKGSTTTITDLFISNELLISSSLDSYVRMYDIASKQLKGKYYLNKPIYSLHANFIETVDVDIKEEEINMEEDQFEETEKPKIEKIKQIRKRNKVGLKYLEPRQFDEPEPDIKTETIPQKWYAKLNPLDRRQFQEQN